jgi:hypothetical protein
MLLTWKYKIFGLLHIKTFRPDPLMKRLSWRRADEVLSPAKPWLRYKLWVNRVPENRFRPRCNLVQVLAKILRLRKDPCRCPFVRRNPVWTCRSICFWLWSDSEAKLFSSISGFLWEIGTPYLLPLTNQVRRRWLSVTVLGRLVMDVGRGSCVATEPTFNSRFESGRPPLAVSD